MAAKPITAFSDTAQTIYAVIRREADGFFMNDADGSFSAAPADAYLSLTEHGTIKGLYTASENRTVWTDGEYSYLIYSQTGGAPATATDFPLGAESVSIRDNSEISVGDIISGGSTVDITGITGQLANIKAALRRIPTDTDEILINDFGRLYAAITSLQQSLLRGR